MMDEYCAEIEMTSELSQLRARCLELEEENRRIKEKAKELIRGMPLMMDGGGFFYPMYDGEGNYIGEQRIDETSVIQMLVEGLENIRVISTAVIPSPAGDKEG
jgi:hypothetical protein